MLSTAVSDYSDEKGNPDCVDTPFSLVSGRSANPRSYGSVFAPIIKPRFSHFLLLYNSDDQPKAETRHQGSYLYRLGGTPVLFQSLHPATVHRANARR